ncbi:hypothetical protein ACR9E3_10130 [Actinomycetospora sp. C-140]
MERHRTALLALMAGASASLVPGVAHADAVHVDTAHVDEPALAPSPVAEALPYGGQLVPGVPAVGTDEIVEVGLLGFGALNAVGLVAAGVVDAVRGPSPEETRRALMARSGPGTVSERVRDRRGRATGTPALRAA